MSAFAWEPLDFLDVLGVGPVEEDSAISYRYTLDQGPLHLTLTIWPMQGDVELALRCQGFNEPVIHLNLLNCPGARIVDDKRGKYIEFAAANLFAGRYDNSRPAPYGFRLRVEPSFQVTAYSYDC